MQGKPRRRRGRFIGGEGVIEDDACCGAKGEGQAAVIQCCSDKPVRAPEGQTQVRHKRRKQKIKTTVNKQRVGKVKRNAMRK